LDPQVASSNSTRSSGVPSDTDPTDRFSSITMDTDISFSTDRTSISSISTAPKPTGRLSAAPEQSFCPICNMGDGHFARPYNKAATNGHVSAGTPDSIGQSPSQWKPSGPRYANTKPTWFNKHVTEGHKKLFLRTKPSDFVCGICACEKLTCVARFNDFKSLLEHLWDFHKQASLNRDWHYHHCLPWSTFSDL
jgi:hypothetical protein